MSAPKRLAAAAATVATALLLTAGVATVAAEGATQPVAAPRAATATSGTPALCAALLPSLPGLCLTL